MAMENLILKQKQLMDEVPHDIRPDVVLSMKMGMKVVENLMLYLNSLGHKPWRSTPLPEDEQVSRAVTFLTSANHLIMARHQLCTQPVPELERRQLISSFGMIEEAAEYMESVEFKGVDDRKEELTDVLFFWMEQLIMSGFTWEQIEAEYHRKWAVNMDRYKRGKDGDYSWDKRKEGKL